MKGLRSIDLLVDGFIARTFAPVDASSYLMLLLKTQHFIQEYGIVYHQGAWYIRHNVSSVQGTSPGVPFQTAPLLDHSTEKTYGTVVPQQLWTSVDEVDVRRFIQDAVLQLPIFFLNRSGGIGFPLVDILRGYDRDVHNPNGFAPLGGRATTHIRISVSLSLSY
jgi:hypothetical protein